MEEELVLVLVVEPLDYRWSLHLVEQQRSFVKRTKDMWPNRAMHVSLREHGLMIIHMDEGLT